MVHVAWADRFCIAWRIKTPEPLIRAPRNKLGSSRFIAARGAVWTSYGQPTADGTSSPKTDSPLILPSTLHAAIGSQIRNRLPAASFMGGRIM